MAEMSLREVSDRLEINDVLARYVLAVDTDRWDLFDQVFTADAELDYTPLGAGKGTREEMRAALSELLKAFPGRQHVIGSVRVTVDGDEATASASFTDTLTPSRDMIAATSPGIVRGGGIYHHRLVRTPDGWRSRELTAEQLWRTIQ